MKLMPLKALLTLLSITLSSTYCIAQSTTAQRVQTNERLVPQAVLKVFNEQYPSAYVKGWYATHITYWQNDYSSGWYNDWYGQRQVIVYTYSKPTYFEVEFTNGPGELSRAIYNLNGYWYETRTQMRGLPEPLFNTLKASEYAEWKISPLKEKIEAAGWPIDIYRFKVSKGMKGKIIRMDEQGNFIQEKTLRSIE
ncbi:MAG: hypothetical protein Salg2KO_19270 [Salibacteraceae bacterium]